MKKKRNFLTIISSILGVLTICSFSMFGFLNGSSKKANSVKAEDVVSLRNYSISEYTTVNMYGYDREEDLETLIVIYYKYDINYNKYYDNSVSYGFIYSLDYYFALYTLQQSGYVFDYYVFQNNNKDKFNITWRSDRTSDALSVPTYLELISYSMVFDNRTTTYNGLSARFENYIGDDAYQMTKNNRVQFFNSSLQPVYCLNADAYTTFATSRPTLFETTMSINISDYDLGYNDGYSSGYNVGYNDGNVNGYNQGVLDGIAQAEQQAQVNIDNAYQQGYSEGFSDADRQDEVVTSIFSGILQVAMVPINFFLAIFNFEILGINLSAFIRAIFTVVLTIIVIKTVMGKGGGGSDN